MRHTLFTLMLTGSISGSLLYAQKAQIQDTGTFSSMYYNEEGGDALGFEIRVLKGGGSYWVLFQYAEGPVLDPVLVKANVAGTKISFDLPKTVEGFGKFTGTIQKGFLVGKFSEQKDTLKLKRGKSYWD